MLGGQSSAAISGRRGDMGAGNFHFDWSACDRGNNSQIFFHPSHHRFGLALQLNSILLFYPEKSPL
jgi:hypothetical protein